MPYFRYLIQGRAGPAHDRMGFYTTRTFHALEEATARKKALSSARREFGGSAKVEDVWQVSLLASFRPPNRGATFYEESDL